MKHSFTASIPSEWMDISTVTRILGCTPQRVLELVDAGILNGRNAHGEVRISSASLDAYSATKPLFGRPAPPTYEKTRHGVRLVIE
jgi:hypothetical protein